MLTIELLEEESESEVWGVCQRPAYPHKIEGLRLGFPFF